MAPNKWQNFHYDARRHYEQYPGEAYNHAPFPFVNHIMYLGTHNGQYFEFDFLISLHI